MLGRRKNSKPEKKLENSYSPTRPLHAMLDELLVYRDCVFIIVLKCRAAISYCKERRHPLEIWEPREHAERGKTDKQAESTHPENGQDKKEVVKQRQISMN